MKKIIALLLALVLCFSLVACGPKAPAGNTQAPAGNSQAPAGPETPEYKDLGTIMWLSNLSSGPGYDVAVDYMEALCKALGYEFTVVYGDPFNDAAGNLTAVTNGMSEDVVGLITSQDGGMAAIMEEYPELWVAGYNTDMRSVYNADGENHSCLSNPKFLGSIADGFVSGYDQGAWEAEYVINAGCYKKLAIINFPFFAYPSLTEADTAFRAAIDEYNKTASEPIEIVGETTTLMFEPLSDQWFLEPGHSDLDLILGMCAGVTFVYPTMINAITNGTCSADTKMLTSGFETDPDILADIGEGGRIGYLRVSPAEDPAYALILIDNAITGNVAPGTKNDCIDSALYLIDSAEDVNNVMTKSLMGTGDPAYAHLTVEEIVAMCGRSNPNLTWEELVNIFQSISVDELK